ncbi:acid beta-fructofuranosidase-like [Andrographis paniculata]|uniref:acid beta-fructofuranosidase-like n=1 Tax=Andrographis paniculata TaxID=175694 RepID=UPI0021E9A059|nr:acid beta-fructofuranosidase-like [Andrographis paniculata]
MAAAAAAVSHAPPRDLEASAAYSPIPGGPASSSPTPIRKRHVSILVSFLCIFGSLLLLISGRWFVPHVARLDLNRPSHDHDATVSPARPLTGQISRGPSQGVSEKVFRQRRGGASPFSWSNVMLTWQRTAYHFQPEKNWMNDPNGPLYHKGWYHFFYQYSPKSAVWGNITWGHAVSRDLIHWFHLPSAMVPDQWYDANGVWTGSATVLPDGRIVMLYTGDTNDVVQVQCLAHPANLSDPLLLKWVKHSGNPVMVPPVGIRSKDFRDPTTAWLSPSGDTWRVSIGSKIGNKTGVALVYETVDFLRYELLDGYMHRVAGTGMWECVDFYPVSLTTENGLDTSENGSGVKHVMKVSLDDDKNDYYSVGSYDPDGNKWVPDDPNLDVGIGLRYDYGKFYASKTFYDPKRRRRILFGWIMETDAEELDILKGWASVQSIPRTIVFDQKTRKNILQWPVEEVESLRLDGKEYNLKLEPGTIVPLGVNLGSQLDITATFEVHVKAISSGIDQLPYDCATSGGASNRGVLGPFGVVVLADNELSELTPIYFYIARGYNRTHETHTCADGLRSSKAPDVEKVVYGSKVPVLDGEKLTLRSLVDHSIIESFAQGGRTVITSRVYPTRAIDGAASVFLFNNATDAMVTASIKIWKMGSADLRPFPMDQL